MSAHVKTTSYIESHYTHRGYEEIARLDHEGGGGVVEFNRVQSLVVVEAPSRACAPVELGLCDESVDDHAAANQRRLLFSNKFRSILLHTASKCQYVNVLINSGRRTIAYKHCFLPQFII